MTASGQPGGAALSVTTSLAADVGAALFQRSRAGTENPARLENARGELPKRKQSAPGVLG